MSKLLNITTFSVSVAVGFVALVGVFAWMYLLDTLLTVTTLALWAGGVFVVVATGAGAFGVVVWAMGLYARASEVARRERLASEEYAAAVAAKWRDVHMPQITVAEPGSQVYQTEINRMSITRPLHLSPGTVNGYNVQHSDPELSRWQQWNALNATGSRPPELEAPSQLAIEAPPPPLLDVLAVEQRLLLCGPSGSGKSSLLRHIINAKLEQACQIVLCDPHGAAPKWGADVNAVGFGERYEDILQTFAALEHLHKERIQAIAQGHPERGFPLIVCVIEEAQALVGYFKRQKIDIGHYFQMFLTRTRKTGIDVIAVSQEATVKSLGLEGYGRNRDAFSTVLTQGRDGRDHRVIYTDERAEVHEYDAPPLWPSSKPVGVPRDRVLILPPPPTEEESKVLEMVRQGHTRYAIAKALWGSTGGKNYRKIADICAKFGVDEPATKQAGNDN